jgi:hypothetical protein
MTNVPSRRLKRAAAAHRRALEQLEKARDELQEAVLEDVAAGVRQADVVAVSGYTRERVRQLARKAGLPPAH